MNITLTPGQASAVAELRVLSRARARRITAAGIRPTCHALLIGSSGAGKSFVARELARLNSASFFQLSCGSWLLDGHDREHSTLRALARWIKDLWLESQGGVLLLDECDKLGCPRGDNHNSIYNRAVYDEILALLDARPRASGWEDVVTAHFDQYVMVVCAGAFQDLYRSEAGNVLLDEQWQQASIKQRLWMADWLPDEFLTRVGAAVVELAPPPAEWIAQRLLLIDVQMLGRPRLQPAEYTRLASEMLRGRRNLRGIEEYVLDAFRAGPQGYAYDRPQDVDLL